MPTLSNQSFRKFHKCILAFTIVCGMCNIDKDLPVYCPLPLSLWRVLWLCMKGFKSLVLFQVIFFSFPKIFFFFKFNFFQISQMLSWSMLLRLLFFKILLFFIDANIIRIYVFFSSKWRSNKKVSNFHLLDSLFLGVGF